MTVDPSEREGEIAAKSTPLQRAQGLMASQLAGVMALLGDEHPAKVYTAEGYDVWLRGVASQLLAFGEAEIERLDALSTDLLAEVGRLREALGLWHEAVPERELDGRCWWCGCHWNSNGGHYDFCKRPALAPSPIEGES